MAKRARGVDSNFDNVDDTLLTENDLQEVKKAVITLAAKARSLGLALGLSVSKLDTIRSDFNDSDEVLTEVLNTWLKQAYDVEKYGCPSWRSLARAVDNDAGGRNSALANKIAADVSENEPQQKRHRGLESHKSETELQQVTTKKQPRRIQKTTGKYAGTTYTFVEAVPKYLCCSKCKVLPVEPYRVQSKLFCESCVQHVDVSYQNTLESASKEQIQELEIMCTNSDGGCKWIGKLGEVESHQSVCPKEMIQCQFIDIGCHETMLRDEAGKHNEIKKDKHLQCAISTIDELKQTDTDIRHRMKQLEDDFRSKIEELRLKYEGVIRQLKEEISLYPPVVVSTIDLYWHNNSLPLTVCDIVHDRTFMSTGFYSHPHGFKLSVILKCSTEVLKIRVVALQQENPALKWPCKGVAIITLQPKGKDAQQFNVEFDIPRSTAVHEIEELGEEGYKDCPIPQIWYGDQYSTVTLKIEGINLN